MLLESNAPMHFAANIISLIDPRTQQREECSFGTRNGKEYDLNFNRVILNSVFIGFSNHIS